MKGVNTECIEKKAEDEYNGDLVKLYEDLFNGKELTFDLCKGKVVFKRLDM